MKLRFFSISLLLISTIVVQAQNPGYFGVKNLVGAHLEFINGGFTGIPFGVQFERTLSRRFSLVGHYNRNYGKMDYESGYNYVMPELLLEPGGAPNTQVDNRLNGTFKYYVNSYNLAIKMYRRKRGAIAPIGRFLYFGYRVNTVNIYKTDPYLTGKYQNPNNPSDQYEVVIPVESAAEKIDQISVNYYFGFGEQRFISKKQYFEYCLYFALEESGSSDLDRLNSANVAYNIVLEDVVRRSFIHFKLAYGIGI